ncbi:MAG TPA: tRNA epoxyqueuosine(34) reductase QueG [Vicinamibacterales bacterium]|nr:tRNA epoxyqueuosine(34) reductase QueG [Vicinamibacterales bacterium]
MLTSERIKRRAHELGFDLCGIAPARRHPELDALPAWLDRGYAGTMTYLHRSAARRADVRRVLPTARAVIMTGTVYNTPRPYSTDGRDPSRALIARYAWGDDYHEVLGRRLDALVAWMRDEADGPFDARAYVDTGPVQERVYAQHAGLGWIGKNTCLISPGHGSWLFLGEVLCSLPLEPDAPGFDRCGTCTLCLDSCPTGALVEPRQLDATKCLSFLTIELKQTIPPAQRASIGTHVYGCDVCQEVCPWNLAPIQSADPAWQPRPALDLPRLLDLWRMSDAGLQALLDGTAMVRAPLTAWRRNLAVAIGNSDDRDAAAELERPRDDAPSLDDPMVAAHVRWAVERLRAPALGAGRAPRL